MPADYKRERRVEFSETDLAGIIHYSSYYQYMEETEHEFLRSLGLSVQLHDEETSYGFPRLSTRCEYSRPLRFEDIVQVHLRITRIGARSITYQFLFSSGGGEVARGEVTVACVVRDDEGKMKSSQIPDCLATQLSVYPGEPLTFGPPPKEG
jgi:YbgC/YbaW family acyl-CoA thioester hydrolase